MNIAEFVLASIAVATVVGSVFAFFFQRAHRLRRYEFTTYHRLIKELVERDDPDVPKKLARQISVIFELRNYPKYGENTKMVLDHFRDSLHTSPVGAETQESLNKRNALYEKAIDSTLNCL